jgi:hypothetical protein
MLIQHSNGQLQNQQQYTKKNITQKTKNETRNNNYCYYYYHLFPIILSLRSSDASIIQ